MKTRSRSKNPSLLFLLAVLAPLSAIGAPRSDPGALLKELRHEQALPTPPPDSEVSRRLTEIARELMAGGAEAESIELLSEAVSRDPANGLALASLTLAYAKHGDLVFAEYYLELARQSAARGDVDPGIYESLGDIYEAENRMEEAAVAWEQARRLGRDTPRLRARIDKARTEWAFSHRQNYLGGERFEVFYDPVIPADAIEALESSLESAALAEAQFFMAPAPVGQVVILYEGRRYFQFEETPDWVGGYYDGKIRVPLEAGHETSEAVLAILRHELAHFFVREISAGRAPSWLQEGLAQHVEGRHTDRRELERIGARAEGFLGGSTDAFHQRTDRNHARRAYALALSFVEFLARLGGPAAAVCLAHSLGTGKTVDAACEENFGEPLSGLERRWIASLS